MEEKMQGIRASDLVVGYEGKSVLKDVNFWVRPGQILTLIGPNGSGKSTLLKSITRQLKTIAGQVYLAEGTMDAYTDAALAKQMAMVTTERISPELMTCRDVVATGRYPYTGRFGVLGKEDEEKVQKALESLHALEVADRLFAKVSDGQRQRVMLARAICQEPKILILDEPTSYLDMHYKLEILQSIRNMVKEENLAVVMSLHELDLAQKVSDLVACVDGETLAKIGRPEEIFCGDTIACLYGVNSQAYDVVSGSMFLQKAKGEPKVFVIGGGGSGIAAYYTLQRDQIPFAAGILSEGDVEYKAAKALASALVTTPAFYPIEIRQMAQARKWIDDCDYCICTLDAFGPLNQANKELAFLCKRAGQMDQRGRKTMAKVIMVQGTMSNAGKSLLVAGLCRVFAQDGYRVAPFKSQNMALNSFITKEGLEMGRAQVMQAEAAGIEPSVDMNPILLKPTNDHGSQVIVAGKVLGNMEARDYFSYKKNLVPDIVAAFGRLEEKADIIVIEGAGSPAEINLKENDIVNMGLAHLVDAPVLLVGDIDRGGVFAQLLGTMMLLT